MVSRLGMVSGIATYLLAIIRQHTLDFRTQRIEIASIGVVLIVQQTLRFCRVIPIEPTGLVSITKHRQVERYTEQLVVIRDVLVSSSLPRGSAGNIQGLALCL